MVWIPQTSFRNGEVAPHVDAMGRPTVYETSCRKIEGGIVSSGGSVEKRCGTVHEGSTGGTGEGTYTSTAIKLIPYTHLSDQYVLVFEVVTQNSETWGIVTSVINNTYVSSGADNIGFRNHGATWLSNSGTNLPFTSLPFSSADAATKFIPLGVDPSEGNIATDKNLFRSCGMHPFSAAQLTEVQYFQHEDSLILCHSEVPPFEVFMSKNKGGGVAFDTRPYDCVHRSPEVSIKGQRFTLDFDGTTFDSAYSVSYDMVSNRDWFSEEDIGHIYRVGHCSMAIATSSGDVSDRTNDKHDDRRGFFVRVLEVLSARRVKVENITDLTVNGRTFVADISDPNDWDGPWVKESQGALTYSHTERGTEDTSSTNVATMSKSEMHLTNLSLSGMNITESSLVGCIISKVKTSDDTKEGYAIINAPSASTNAEGGSLTYADTPFTASLINGDVANIWSTAGSALVTPTVSVRRTLYTVYSSPTNNEIHLNLNKGDTIIFKDTGGSEIGTASVYDSGQGSPSGAPTGYSNKEYVRYYDPSSVLLTEETFGTGNPVPTGLIGSITKPNGDEKDYTYLGGVPYSVELNDLQSGTADLYRLVSKTGESQRYEPTLCWTHQTGTEEASTAQYYTTPKTGDKVFIYIGNLEKPTSDWTSTSTTTAIPYEHEKVFDTRERGDQDVVDPQNIPKVGGVVHLNGGTFALSSRRVNTGTNSDAATRLYYHAYVITPPSNQSITSKYSLGWSHGVGFPACGTSHQGRTYFAGFVGEPQVVVGSSAASPYDFTLGGTAPDSMHFIVNDMRGSLVRWMSSGKDLMLGTTTGEFAIGGAPLSPISVGVERHSAYGSSSIRPVIAGTYLFFVQKDAKTIRAQRYKFDNQRYISVNITEDHRHFFKNETIKEMIVWEGSEDPVVLVRLSNGEVLACRVNEQENTFGWSRMKLPTCSSIAPSRHHLTSQTRNATTGDDFYIAVDATDKYHLARYDCDVMLDQSYTGTPTANVLTLPVGHPLVGQTVDIIADGVYKGTGTVDGTSREIDFSGVMGTTASSATVGYAVMFSMVPRVPEVASSTRSQSTMGRQKNYSSVVVNVNESTGVKVNGFEIDGVPLDLTSNQVTAHTEHTGWLECVATGLYGTQPLLEITSDRPYPLEICGYTVNMSVEG